MKKLLSAVAFCFVVSGCAAGQHKPCVSAAPPAFVKSEAGMHYLGINAVADSEGNPHQVVIVELDSMGQFLAWTGRLKSWSESTWNSCGPKSSTKR